MRVYFDTSGLFKLLVDEDGFANAAALWDSATERISTVLVYPEARAALAGAARAGRIAAADARVARSALERICGELLTVDVDAALAREAGEQARKRRLRGYDAVHLATALTIADPDLVFATWDRDLGQAALAAGFATFPTQ